MQVDVADIIAVAKAAAQLWAAILYAGVMIRAFRHVDAPDAFTGLQFGHGKACRGAEGRPC